MPSTFANFYRHYGMVLTSAQAELIMTVCRTQALNIKSNTELLYFLKVQKNVMMK